MKKRIKKRLSFLLLTLLGFSTACEKQKNGEPPPVMYGTPHVDIWVGGKVTDKTGTPIPGFAAQSVPVEFTEADRVSEAEGWCGGSFARTGVDVTLEEDAQE